MNSVWNLRTVSLKLLVQTIYVVLERPEEAFESRLLPLHCVKYQKLGGKSGELPETLQKLWVSTKFPHQEIS